MNLKYTSLATHEVAGQDASARTHRLTFSEPLDGMGSTVGVGGGHSISLLLTKTEADAYVLGGIYTFAVTPYTET